MDKAAKEKLYRETVDFLNEYHGDGSASLYPDYSGRGMYGKTTPAIVTGLSGVKVGIAIACTMEEPYDALDLVFFTDSMGLTDSVYY